MLNWAFEELKVIKAYEAKKIRFLLIKCLPNKNWWKHFLNYFELLKNAYIIKSVILVFKETKEWFPESHYKKNSTLKSDFKILWVEFLYFPKCYKKKKKQF